jgi:hypothetical protein
MVISVGQVILDFFVSCFATSLDGQYFELPGDFVFKESFRSFHSLPKMIEVHEDTEHFQKFIQHDF